MPAAFLLVELFFNNKLELELDVFSPLLFGLYRLVLAMTVLAPSWGRFSYPFVNRIRVVVDDGGSGALVFAFVLISSSWSEARFAVYMLRLVSKHVFFSMGVTSTLMSFALNRKNWVDGPRNCSIRFGFISSLLFLAVVAVVAVADLVELVYCRSRSFYFTNFLKIF